MNPNTWTPSQLEQEWLHIYETRIAVHCGESTPNPEQIREAQKEADEHIAKLMEQGRPACSHCGGTHYVTTPGDTGIVKRPCCWCQDTKLIEQ